MQFSINRLPNMRPAALAFALAFAALSLAALEGTFRLKGFQPSLSDSDSLWAVSRTQAEADNVGIILVGSSRFQLGIDPTLLSQEAQTSVVNLSLNGTSPFPILDELVQSQAKPDILLIEYIPWRWVNELPENITKAKSQLGYYHNQPYASRYEVFLRSQLGDRWVLLNPILNLRSLLLQLIPGKNKNQTRYRIRPDRFMETVYHDVYDPNKIRVPRAPIEEDHPPDFWIANANQQLAHFEAAVTKLQKSGTEVIVFRIPVCEGQLNLDQERYGEPALFNELKSRSQATWLAADDLTYSDKIECTDGSHLTTQSAHTVTKALAKWLNDHPTPPTTTP